MKTTIRLAVVAFMAVSLLGCKKDQPPTPVAEKPVPLELDDVEVPPVAEVKEEIEEKVENITPVVDPNPGTPEVPDRVVPPVNPPVKETVAEVISAPKPESELPPAVKTPELPKLPKNAYVLMPEVIAAIDDIWPDMPMRSYFPAQIEQESCISLTHSRCWNPRAELKTSREYGFGLGQLTKAYTASGALRFDAWAEVRLQHPSLKDWAWEDRYNPLLQIKAIVVKNKVNWGAIKWQTSDLDNKMAFLATFYNGGNPSKDRNICVNTSGCDPSRWWGNVELYSVKSKVKLKEYGNRSLFEISREYPVNVLRVRRAKYVPYVETNKS